MISKRLPSHPRQPRQIASAGDWHALGQLVFAQVMTYLPLKAFSRMVLARRAQHKVKDFSCLDQFLALSFAQLTETTC